MFLAQSGRIEAETPDVSAWFVYTKVSQDSHATTATGRGNGSRARLSVMTSQRGKYLDAPLTECPAFRGTMRNGDPAVFNLANGQAKGSGAKQRDIVCSKLGISVGHVSTERREFMWLINW